MGVGGPGGQAPRVLLAAAWLVTTLCDSSLPALQPDLPITTSHHIRRHAALSRNSTLGRRKYKELEQVIQTIEHQNATDQGVMVQVLGYIPHTTAARFGHKQQVALQMAVAATIDTPVSNIMIGELATQAHAAHEHESSRLRVEFIIKGMDKEKADHVANAVWSGEFSAKVAQEMKLMGVHMRWPHFEKAGMMLTKKAAERMSRSEKKAKEHEQFMAFALHLSAGLVVFFGVLVFSPSTFTRVENYVTNTYYALCFKAPAEPDGIDDMDPDELVRLAQYGRAYLKVSKRQRETDGRINPGGGVYGGTAGGDSGLRREDDDNEKELVVLERLVRLQQRKSWG